MLELVLMDPNRSATVSVLSEICANLAAGWFGIVLISPATLGSLSIIELFSNLSRWISLGMVFTLFAITLRKEEVV